MDSSDRTYLATQIYSEQATVSYRSLARALKVHVNTAKRILYEFHAHENGKKPNSVHATYLLAGTKKLNEQSSTTNGHVNGADVDEEPMPSSPPPFTSSMLQSSPQDGGDQHSQVGVVPVKSLTLVREESLEGQHCPHSSEVVAESAGQPSKISTRTFRQFTYTVSRHTDYRIYRPSQTLAESCSM